MADQHGTTFEQWCRSKNLSPKLEAELEKLQKKDVTIGAGSAGGFAIPRELAEKMAMLEKKYRPRFVCFGRRSQWRLFLRRHPILGTRMLAIGPARITWFL